MWSRRPGFWRQASATMRRPTGQAHRSSRGGDGGNSATLPEESTKDTVKTSRAGKAGAGITCGPPRVHFCCARTCGCRRHPAFPAPFGLQSARTTCKARAKRAAGWKRHVCATPAPSGSEPHAPLSCLGRSAASLRRCAAEPGPMSQRSPAPLGPGSAPQCLKAHSRASSTRYAHCGLSGTRAEPTPPPSAAPPALRQTPRTACG